MPAPEVVIPLMEGMVGSIANGKETASLWVKMCKEIMLATTHKDQTDWSFGCSEDVDESANDIETGGVLYGLLIGQNSADAENDVFAVVADADGTYTFDGTAAIDNTALFMYNLPAAATDNTEELHPFIFPMGIDISGTNHMCFGADGEDGTNPAANDIRAWYLIRTTPGIVL